MNDASEPVRNPGEGPQHSLAGLGLCVLVAVFEGYDLQVAAITAAEIRLAFDLQPQELGWFFSMGTAGLLIGAAVGGRMSDRYGRKPALIGSVLVFGLASAAASFAHSDAQLFVARFLAGVGMGGTLPNLIAIAAEAAAPKHRGRAVGFVTVGLSMGGAIVAFSGMAVSGPDSWRHQFLAGGVVPLALTALLYALLPKRRAPAAGSQILRAEGVIADVFFGPRLRDTLLLWSASFLILISVYLIANWLPTLMVERGLDRRSALWVQVFFNIAGAAGGLLSGWVVDRPGIRTTGIVILYAAYLGSIFALAKTGPILPLLLMAGAALGAATTAVSAVLYALAPLVYPTRIRGTGVGMAVSVGRVGSILGPLLAGILLGAGMRSGDVLVAMLPLVATAATCAAILSRRLTIRETLKVPMEIKQEQR